jgi:hypothetical protein
MRGTDFTRPRDAILRRRGLDLLERLHGGQAGEAMVAEHVR